MNSMMLTAVAEGTGGNATGTPVVNIKPEPTSEKLTKLRDDKKAAWKALISIEDGESKEAVDAKLAVYNVDQAIKAEITAIKAAEQAAIVAEKRNAKVALMDTYDAAVIALSTAPKADKQAAQDAVTAAREVIVNALLSTVGGTAKVAGDKPAGDNVAGAGATSKAIVELFIANRALGMDDTSNKKAIVDAGFSRGTTGAAVLAWQKENGEK